MFKSLFPVTQLANAISLSRIFGIGFIFWLTPYTDNFYLLLTICIYTVICSTDFLDGWIARKLKIVSNAGKILDPLADKIVVLVFLPLLEMQVISAFPVFIILAREFSIMALRIASAKDGGSVIPATLAGKLKTAVTLTVCGILLARVPVEKVAIPILFEPLEIIRQWILMWPNWWVTLLIYGVVGITLWSFLDYIIAFIWRYYMQKFNNNETQAKKELRIWVPNMITLLNLSCGFTAIAYAYLGNIPIAVLLVLISNIIDVLDGMAARKLDAVSKLGAFLDSKADMVSFGLAPALIIIKSLLFQGYSIWLSSSIGITYFIAVYYRLYRFDKNGHSEWFEGLPSPIGALLVALASISVFLKDHPIFLAITAIVILLMVSKAPYMHSHKARSYKFYRISKYPAVLALLLTCLSLSGMTWFERFYIYEALMLLVISYVISPIFINRKAPHDHT